MSPVCLSLHFLQLSSRFVSGKFQIAVQPQLLMAGIDFMVGNDLANGKVFPSPEVIEKPITDVCVSDTELFPLVPCMCCNVWEKETETGWF